MRGEPIDVLRVKFRGFFRTSLSLPAEYSRFRETLRGDLFRSALRDEVGVDVASLHAAFDRPHKGSTFFALKTGLRLRKMISHWLVDTCSNYRLCYPLKNGA